VQQRRNGLGLSGIRYLFNEGPGSGSLGCAPALTPVLTFNPRATVWLWFAPSIPPDFAVEPMTTSPLLAPAFTFVLIFTAVFPFYEIGVDC
jgi:hypothetical protein